MATFPVGLRPKEDLVSQLCKLDAGLLGCKVGTVWKVSRKTFKIRRVI